MAFKSLVVVAESTGREKLDLASVLDREIASLLEKEKAELTDLKVDAEFSHDGYGRALVTVFYKPVDLGEKKMRFQIVLFDHDTTTCARI